MTEKTTYTLRDSANLQALKNGIQAGVPIGLGYLAVGFSLGIAAKNAGLTPFQSFLTSLLCNASAGEYAGFSLIAVKAAYLELALMMFIANARYMLMSFAMSQRLDPKMRGIHRVFMGFYITDEIFAVSIGQKGYLNPLYTYGAALIASPCWALGTMLGCIAGNLLPARLVSAFSVALFGMFLAVIIPPARKSRVIAGLIAVCFILSYAFAHLPLVSDIAEGTRTIILTVVISAAAALLFPRKEESGAE